MYPLLLLLAPATGAEAAEPTLAAPASIVADARSVSFHLTTPPGGKLWIDGCEPVELERQTPTGWGAIAVPGCDAPRPASAIEGATPLDVPRPAPGTYRALVTYGTDCVAERPLMMAACRNLGFVRSAAVTIP